MIDWKAKIFGRVAAIPADDRLRVRVSPTDGVPVTAADCGATEGNEACLVAGTLSPRYARFGYARFGASRFGYYQPTLHVTINGVSANTKAIRSTLEIDQVLDEQPHTATLEVRAGGTAPSRGQTIIVSLGSIEGRLFAGRILTVTAVMTRSAELRHRYVLQCVDHSWEFGWKRIRGRKFQNVSVSQIVAQLVDEFAPGFTITPATVPFGLPAVDFTSNHGETMQTAFTRLSKMVGGYWMIDPYKRVYMFLSDVPNLGTATPLHCHDFWNFRYTRDISQVLTRALATGGATQTTAPVTAGSTSIAVDDTTLFAPPGLVMVEGNEAAYSGRSTNSGPGSLTGIPTAGPGSISYDIASGASVVVLAVVDDVAQQLAAAALLGTPADGILESSVEDGNWGSAAARRGGESALALHTLCADRILSYTSRDRRAMAGCTVAAQFTTPVSLSVKLLLQRVHIHSFTKGTKWPQRDCEAGANRHDLLDVLTHAAR